VGIHASNGAEICISFISYEGIAIVASVDFSLLLGCSSVESSSVTADAAEAHISFCPDELAAANAEAEAEAAAAAEELLQFLVGGVSLVSSSMSSSSCLSSDSSSSLRTIGSNRFDVLYLV